MISVFVSYKGGAGRTTALANTAIELVRQGKRVLVVDFDLEAPSLHRYFGLSDADTCAEGKLGVLDLAEAFERAATAGTPEAFGGLREAQLLEPRWAAIHTVRNKKVGVKALKAEVLGPKPGRLQIFPAGRFEAGYAMRARKFPWGDYYEQHEAFRGFVAWLKETLTGLADVVLIDSRAGETDVGALCSVALADRILLFCPPTMQALDGTLAFARRCRELRADKAEHACLFVASRVARDAFARPLAEWRAAAKDKVAAEPDLWLTTRFTRDEVAAARAMVEKHQLPEVPFHAVGEPLLRVRMLEAETDNDELLSALAPLAALVMGGRQPEEEVDVETARAALAEAEERGDVSAIAGAHLKLAEALQVLALVSGHVPHLLAAVEEGKIAIAFARAIGAADWEAYLRGGHAICLREIGDRDAGLQEHRAAHALATKSGNEALERLVRQNLVSELTDAGQISAAQALWEGRNLVDRPAAVDTPSGWFSARTEAILLAATGRTEDALGLYEKLQTIPPGVRVRPATSLHQRWAKALHAAARDPSPAIEEGLRYAFSQEPPYAWGAAELHALHADLVGDIDPFRYAAAILHGVQAPWPREPELLAWLGKITALTDATRAVLVEAASHVKAETLPALHAALDKLLAAPT